MTQTHADIGEPTVATTSDGARRSWPARREWCVRTAAFGTALMAHALILYALAREADDFASGAGGHQLDAISVTLVSASSLESRDAAPAKQEAPAPAETVDTTDGAPDSAPSEAREHKDEKKAEQPRDQKPVEAQVEKTEAISEAPPQPTQEPSRLQAPAAPQGGVAARSDAAVPSQASTAAAASPGDIRQFARDVSLALGKTKPRAHGERGSVRVKFVIAPGGSLDYLAIVKSSGIPALDQKAVDAIRLASFPIPPPGMSVTQLTYEVPYHFR